MREAAASPEAVAWSAAREALLTVRLAVFVEEQGVPPELELDEHDATAYHVLVRDPAARPIACGRLLPDGQIGRMAVLPGWRGRGIGRALLQALLSAAAARGLAAVFLHAQCSAVGFY